MYARSNTPIVPRNGHTVITGIVARISGCPDQKEVSNEDQVDHGKELAAELHGGPMDYQIISTIGKGERLDRPELQEIEAKLRQGTLDLLIMEDMGRLVRGTEAVRLFGVAVDHGTRAISPNDNVDTINPTWEEDATAACRDHVAHNAHTSKRLKHKLMNRFLKFGGATARPIYGYIVPDAAKTYSDWQLDTSASVVILQGLKLLKEIQNCSAVADYFNSVPVSVGPYCRRAAWDGKMIRRFYRNRLLGGVTGRGFRHTIKHHGTGRRISVLNPAGPQFREYAHLAHVDLVELDEVNSLLSNKNKALGRKLFNGVDPRFRVPRKRTRWPAQGGSTCWYCGAHHVWGGNGITGNLMCSRSREWRCWNSIGFDGSIAVRGIVQAITSELYSMDGLDKQFRELVTEANRRGDNGAAQKWKELEREQESLAREKNNVKDALRNIGDPPTVREALREIQEKESRLAAERRQLEHLGKRKLVLPNSVAELRALLEEQFEKLTIESAEFGLLLQRLVPQFAVFLVRLCDGGHLLPRAKIKLALDGIVGDAKYVPGLNGLLTKDLTLDLFNPPQRERIRAEAVVLAAKGLGPKAIAGKIVERPTTTAVQDALTLHRTMMEMKLDSPYIIMTEPPADYTKLRRHRNSKYRFDPLSDYERPAL